MIGDLALLVALSLLARLGPRTILPYAMDSDAAYHLLAARRIRENGFKIPSRLRGYFFPGPYNYPPLFHFLLALIPRRALECAERFVGTVIDVCYVLVCYVFMLIVLTGQYGLDYGTARTRGLAVAVAFSISPALLYMGRGPRAYGANPRVFAELVFGIMMLFVYRWHHSGQWWALVGASAFAAILLLSSKFGAQVLVLFFPALAVGLGAGSLLAVPVLGLLLATAVSRGHYLRVALGHLGHLVLFAKVAGLKGSPLAPKSEWGTFWRLLRTRPRPGTLYRLLCTNSISCFLIRNPQLYVLAVAGGRGGFDVGRDAFLIAWVAASIAAFVLVSARRLQFVGEAERYVAYSLPAQFVLLAVGWEWLPVWLWWAFVGYSVVGSLAYQAVFIMVNWKLPARRHDGAELRAYFQRQTRTLRVLPVGEGPHILAYTSGHEVFYPCGNFEIWYTPVEEYVKLYEELPRPRAETLEETLTRYGIDSVLVNKHRDERRFTERLAGYPVLFENESFVLFDTRRASAAENGAEPRVEHRRNRSEARLVVCFIGKFVHPVERQFNLVNEQTFVALGRRAERIVVIGESQDGRMHRQAWGDGEVEVVLLRRRMSGPLGHPFFATRAIIEGIGVAARRRVDVWVASEPLGGGLACLILRQLCGGRMMVEVQGELLDLRTVGKARRRMIRLMTLFSCRGADRVRCVSRRIMEQLSNAGVQRRKLHYLPTRCDTRRFDPERFRSERQARRRELGVEADTPLIIAVGSVNLHKAYGDLLRAMLVVLEKEPRARLVIVGDGPERTHIESQARELGLEGTVTLAGRVAYEEVPGWLAAADVFALSSRNEGTPRAVLEAMAMGLPVVATSVGGVPEVVIEGETGYLVPPGDSAALGRALAEVLADLEEGRCMGARGRARVMTEFEFEKRIDDFYDLLVETAHVGRG